MSVCRKQTIFQWEGSVQWNASSMNEQVRNSVFAVRQGWAVVRRTGVGCPALAFYCKPMNEKDASNFINDTLIKLSPKIYSILYMS